ncbi:response regulator transcription factor [Kineococcus rhizosphaerae]|uniref:DNA-binding CsgD family transcriptional regulator n=1 Tax=Kineococcus rhizosphaerae TaxID=559628 RepID=A0A2T0R3B9_9ACTN|nr:helix-turn-helix transcriptional regulator [Kineococcus rhizosphaerae]PRY14493.1 DNA-binding CsgD family transcriptional regulator [Kineococcus rhizosphaerae]
MSSPDLGLHALAARVRSEGLVRAQVGDTRLVCLTEDAFERLTGRSSGDHVRENPSPAVHLTPREVQALRLVAGGLTAAETAAVLGVAVNTVSQHLVGARRKYGVSSTRAAVERARRDGAL